MGMCTYKFVKRIDVILSILTRIKKIERERENVLKETPINKNVAIQKVSMNIFTKMPYYFRKDLYQ